MVDLVTLLQGGQPSGADIAAAAKNANALLGAGLGLGLAVIGVGLGIGRIGGQAQELIAQARAVAEKERAALLAQAREQYEQLLDRARKEIESEKEKAILELRREAVDLSIAAASKLIEANLDSDANRRLVMEYLASLEAGAEKGGRGAR